MQAPGEQAGPSSGTKFLGSTEARAEAEKVRGKHLRAAGNQTTAPEMPDSQGETWIPWGMRVPGAGRATRSRTIPTHGTATRDVAVLRWREPKHLLLKQ